MAASNPLEEAGKRFINRRRFLQTAGLGTVGLALGISVGCDNKSNAPGGTLASPTSQVTEQPVRGGTLRVLASSDLAPATVINSLNPANYWLNSAVHERLIDYRPAQALDPQPQLAESWAFSPDYTSLTFKLRSGVKFHTGRPLTSEDVKWNIELRGDPKTASQLLGVAKWVQKVETPDAQTVVCRLDRPRPAVLDLFHGMFIGDPETHQETMDGKNFVGTGPFKFKEWVPGDHWTMVRNPDYWQKDRPYLDEITVRVIPDNSTKLINLQTGEADVAVVLEPRDAKDLLNDKNYAVLTAPVMYNCWYVGIDVKNPYFSDKRARQAISYLLDRQRIVDTILFFGEATQLVWDKNSPAYTPELAHTQDYNPAKAKDLLAQAGVPSGITVTHTCPTGYAESHAFSEILQAELAKLGIKSSIEKIDSGPFIQKLSAAQFGGFFSSGVGFMNMTPSNLFVFSYPYRIPNASNFDTPEYRQLLTDISETVDEAELKKIYVKMNQYLLDQSFMIPIASMERPMIATAKVKGLHYNRSAFPVLVNTWKSK